MCKINPLLLLDFYKTTHAEQYAKGTTRIVSYFTPRMSRREDEAHLILFGLQGFIKTYLIRAFDAHFFSRPLDEIMAQYRRILDNTLGRGIVNYEKVEKLHALGCLPIRIKALPEGTRTPVGIPMFEITNTHKDFAWLVNTLETAISASLWHPMISANVGYRYREIVNRYYAISVDDDVRRARAMGDFSMRGQESVESAIASSAAFCLSFLNTATVPAIVYLEENYACDCTKEEVAFGAISTEHSVMNCNFAADGDEITMIKRLLTEIYPDNGFSMVSDSYDYWNLVDNLLPACREEILRHNGYLAVRGDSGDPVEITVETVRRLWSSFGGALNRKGFKVLDPHIRVIYGDSITPQRAEAIYAALCAEGFACNNVSLGAGSFSLQCAEERAGLAPFTRDTFGIAIKATYAEIGDRPLMLFKDPKTDTDRFKKSRKGCCAVRQGADGRLACIDGLTFGQCESDAENLLEPVFLDGRMIREQSLADIRKRLYGDNF
jgi:nicotinamide phosphoribosyltransferase